MHGKVLALLVEKGAQVTRGQRVAIIEAMKMEHTIVAPIDGVVTEIMVAKDAQIAEGAKLWCRPAGYFLTKIRNEPIGLISR